MPANETAMNSETTAETIKASETALNQILESLKSKNISKEEHDRLWAEAYETAISLLDYKIKMGREIAEIAPASGQRTDLVPVGKEVISKKAFYERLGLTQKQAADYQIVAGNPAAVELAKLEAKKNKCLPTVYLVKKLIKAAKESTANDGATPAVSSETPKTSGNVAPQYFSIFANNMKCAELPESGVLEDFVSTTVEKLNEGNAYTGKTYIYFEASQDKLLEYLTKIKEMTDVAQTGICIRHE